MKTKKTFYIIFFTCLVILFYVVLMVLIPGFSKSRFPAIGRIQPFSFVNQDGKNVTEKDVEGKVFVANYFFTTCKYICPHMNDKVKQVFNHFKTNNDFLILSHTSDPATDSAARLKQYSDSIGANSHWIFLTGRKDSLYRQARLSYKIDDPKNNLRNINDDFLHTQFLALVNKKGEVVKIYDGLNQKEIDQLISDAEKLLKE